MLPRLVLLVLVVVTTGTRFSGAAMTIIYQGGILRQEDAMDRCLKEGLLRDIKAWIGAGTPLWVPYQPTDCVGWARACIESRPGWAERMGHWLSRQVVRLGNYTVHTRLVNSAQRPVPCPRRTAYCDYSPFPQPPPGTIYSLTEDGLVCLESVAVYQFEVTTAPIHTMVSLGWGTLRICPPLSIGENHHCPMPSVSWMPW